MTTPSPLMTPEASVQTNGGCCPVCRSGQIAGESFDVEAAQVSQRLCCLDCAAVWTAVYALQGYTDLERPGALPPEEQARLLREVLRNRDLNPSDVLDLAEGVEAALLALPAIQEHLWVVWREEHARAAEEADARAEQPSTPSGTPCSHNAWAADEHAQRATRRARRTGRVCSPLVWSRTPRLPCETTRGGVCLTPPGRESDRP
ncbi:MAG: hypothetical protein AB7N91_10505 [Candidatus Tectimicrobiota bacterium]